MLLRRYQIRPRRRASLRRRGAVVALVALLLPVIVGMVAIGVDFAVVTTARAQMQTATDAAALAAASSLASERRLQSTVNMTTEMKTAQGRANTLAVANKVIGAAPVLKYEAGTANGGDVVIGYLSPSDTTSAGPDASMAASKFNSVRVFGKRDATHGGLVPGFFSGLFNTSGFGVRVSSTATAHPYKFKGFNPTGGGRAGILPIVLDKTTYDNFKAGLTGDSYSYNTTTGAVTSAPDGVKETVIYPVGSGSPGNWGTINFGVSNNSTSVLGDQIRNGVTAAQMAAEFPGGTSNMLNQTSDSRSYHRFTGDPGISSGIKDDLTSIMGKPVLLPIYDQNGGNGNNAWYDVIDYVPVRIVEVDFKGNPKYVIVQPALMTNPNMVTGAPMNDWSQGGVIRLFLSR